MRRNIRKRSGNLATGRYLSLNGDKIAIFQNIAIPEYVKTVFGSKDMASLFGRYRKSVRKPTVTRKRMLELIDIGKAALLSGSLRTDPFSEEMMDLAYGTRRPESGSKNLWET